MQQTNFRRLKPKQIQSDNGGLPLCRRSFTQITLSSHVIQQWTTSFVSKTFIAYESKKFEPNDFNVHFTFRQSAYFEFDVP